MREWLSLSALETGLRGTSHELLKPPSLNTGEGVKKTDLPVSLVF
jgi:hypothetical protein